MKETPKIRPFGCSGPTLKQLEYKCNHFSTPFTFRKKLRKIQTKTNFVEGMNNPNAKRSENETDRSKV